MNTMTNQTLVKSLYNMVGYTPRLCLLGYDGVGRKLTNYYYSAQSNNKTYIY